LLVAAGGFGDSLLRAVSVTGVPTSRALRSIAPPPSIGIRARREEAAANVADRSDAACGVAPKCGAGASGGGAGAAVAGAAGVAVAGVAVAGVKAPDIGADE